MAKKRRAINARWPNKSKKPKKPKTPPKGMTKREAIAWWKAHSRHPGKGGKGTTQKGSGDDPTLFGSVQYSTGGGVLVDFRIKHVGQESIEAWAASYELSSEVPTTKPDDSMHLFDPDPQTLTSTSPDQMKHFIGDIGQDKEDMWVYAIVTSTNGTKTHFCRTWSLSPTLPSYGLKTMSKVPQP